MRAPAAILACLAFAAPAWTQQAGAQQAGAQQAAGEQAGGAGEPVLSIEGRVTHPLAIPLADLKTYPAATVETDFAHEGGSKHETFSGAPVIALLDKAAMIDEPGKKTSLQHVLMARGRDGYAVAIAIGELDPKLEGKTAIVAWEQDGEPTKGLRLVVPGDRHGARSVHDLVAIEVR